MTDHNKHRKDGRDGKDQRSGCADGKTRRGEETSQQKEGVAYRGDKSNHTPIYRNHKPHKLAKKERSQQIESKVDSQNQPLEVNRSQVATLREKIDNLVCLCRSSVRVWIYVFFALCTLKGMLIVLGIMTFELVGLENEGNLRLYFIE